MQIPERQPRDIILKGGPQNGTLINFFTDATIILKFGLYRATGNMVDGREVYEWELKP